MLARDLGCLCYFPLSAASRLMTVTKMLAFHTHVGFRHPNKCSPSWLWGETAMHARTHENKRQDDLGDATWDANPTIVMIYRWRQTTRGWAVRRVDAVQGLLAWRTSCAFFGERCVSLRMLSVVCFGFSSRRNEHRPTLVRGISMQVGVCRFIDTAQFSARAKLSI